MSALYYTNVYDPAWPEVELNARLVALHGSKDRVVIGANNLDWHIDDYAERVAGNVRWALRDAAKKQKSKRLWGCFKLTLWLGAAAIGICAYNGIWEPLFYATAPVWYPLVLITDAYSSYAAHQLVAQAFAGASEPQHAMSPVEKTGLVLGALLMLILFKLDKLEQRK